VSKVSSARLKQLVKLSKRKETLLAQIQNIDREMVQLEQQFREARTSKKPNARLTFSRETKKSGNKRRS
jgi:hypothetical protein